MKHLRTLLWVALAMSVSAPAFSADHTIGVVAGLANVDASDPAGSEQLQRGVIGAARAVYTAASRRAQHDIELGLVTGELGGQSGYSASHLGIAAAYAWHYLAWQTPGGRGGVGAALDLDASMRNFEPDGFTTWLFLGSIGPSMMHSQVLWRGELSAALRLPIAHWVSAPPYSVENPDTFRIGDDGGVLFDELAGFAAPHELLRATLQVSYELRLSKRFGAGLSYRGTYARQLSARGAAIATNEILLLATTHF